jgi:hypothetical protein
MEPQGNRKPGPEKWTQPSLAMTKLCIETIPLFISFLKNSKGMGMGMHFSLTPSMP